MQKKKRKRNRPAFVRLADHHKALRFLGNFEVRRQNNRRIGIYLRGSQRLLGSIDEDASGLHRTLALLCDWQSTLRQPVAPVTPPTRAPAQPAAARA